MRNFAAVLSLVVCMLLDILCLTHASSGNSYVNEVKALLAFKNSIIDTDGILQDWDAASRRPCKWKGISCSGNRVVKIALSERNLQGTIAAELGDLKSLQVISLDNNGFQGSIPESIFRLHNLIYINLSGNNLTGTIPDFQNCSNLNVFNLAKNTLSGPIPQSLLKCTSLQNLSLEHNAISGSIPLEIGRLQKLQTLSLNQNSLTGSVPESIGNCSELLQLGLSTNMLSGRIPASLVNCKKLQVFKAAHNSLSGPIPADIGNQLRELVNLTLNSNNLSGNIPESLGNCSQLDQIDLSNNSFSGDIPLSLLNAKSLTVLALSHNMISGDIPAQIGTSLPKLQNLRLSKNRFSGTIPDSLGRASVLNNLDLSDNRLHGVIPGSLARLPNLQFLSMDDNFLESGVASPDEPIPLLKTFPSSTKLMSLHIHGNNLTGTLPSDIGLIFPSLQALNLSRNSISGQIPESLGNLSNLLILDLGLNKLTGPIPLFSAIKSLKEIDLRDNELQGTIPRQLGLMNKNLSSLYLSGNRLTGPIPASIGELPSLSELLLNSNNLTGEIPGTLANCSNLSRLDLSINNLSGPLTTQMTEQLTVTYLNLSYNKLHGSLPDSLQTSLEVLDLSHNHFSGPLPGWAKKNGNSISVNLSYNDLQGSISCGLAGIDLSGNSKIMCAAGKKQMQYSTEKTMLFVTLSGLCALVLLGVISVVNACKCRKPKESEIEMRSADYGFLLSEKEVTNATDNFSPQNFLGQGCYGQVYKGVLADGMTVAVKIFSEHIAERSLFRECQTLGQIRHRNLVKVITACSTHKFKALILQFMSNGSLHNLLHTPWKEAAGLMPLCLSTRVRICREIASAISYLHHDCNPPISHCDIKPQNVLLDETMTVHLSDFGIARILGQSDTVTWNIEGSIGYIAPEYALAAQVWSKGDVYSYGIILLEVMTRRRPTDPMLGNEFTLASWVSMALAQGREYCRHALISNTDGQGALEFMSEEDMSVFEEMLKLGLSCCSQHPDRRPTMRQVEAKIDMLSRAKKMDMKWNLEYSLPEHIKQEEDAQVDILIHPLVDAAFVNAKQ